MCSFFFITPGANKTRGVNYLLYLIDWIESQLFCGISEKTVSMHQSNGVDFFFIIPPGGNKNRSVNKLLHFIWLYEISRIVISYFFGIPTKMNQRCSCPFPLSLNTSKSTIILAFLKKLPFARINITFPEVIQKNQDLVV